MTVTLSSPGSTGQPQQQLFTKSGTFTPPNGVTRARVRVIGGGASGGCGGGFIDRVLTVTPGVPITVTVAAQGGTSQFGTQLLATGGNSQPYSASVGSTGYAYTQSGIGEEIGVSRGGLSLTRAISVPSFPTSGYQTTPFTYGACPVPINGVYCILDPNGTTTYTSTDGINWTTNASALPATCAGMSYAGSYFVTVLAASGNTAYYSANGVSWTAVTMPSTAVWVLIGSNGTALAYVSGSTTAATVSSNTNWTAQSLPAIPASLPYQAGSYFFFYSATTVYYSSTGATSSWSAAAGVTTMGSVWYLNGYYVLLAAPLAAGTVAAYYSATGTAFTAGTVLSGGTATTPTVLAGVAGTTLFVSVVCSTTTYVIYSTSNGIAYTYLGTATMGYWAPNLYSSSSNKNYGMYGQVIVNIAIPNNRYFSIINYYSIYSGQPYYQASPILFSDGFCTGNVQLNYNIGLYAGAIAGGALSTSYTPFTNNGTPEGYCQGSYGSSNTLSPNFGGGSGVGGQGLVIVEWVA